MLRGFFGGGLMDPSSIFDSAFESINMMNALAHPNNIHAMMNGMANAPGSYFSSTVVSMTDDGSGRPQVYQATQSQRVGPNGVRETQSSVRDSATGLQKMSIGHHIGDKAHIVAKSKNIYTGEEEEEDDCINLDDQETERFENEWKTRANAANVHRHNAITYGRRPRSYAPQLALTAAPSTIASSNETDHVEIINGNSSPASKRNGSVGMRKLPVHRRVAQDKEDPRAGPSSSRRTQDCSSPVTKPKLKKKSRPGSHIQQIQDPQIQSQHRKHK